jgi:putative transposase
LSSRCDLNVLLERIDGVVMNHKKIRRLMRKYGLVAKIRQANPYRKLARATQEHKTCDNILNRQFHQDEPEKVLLTDITHLSYNNGRIHTPDSCSLSLDFSGAIFSRTYAR